jgi:hypothetical protein
MSMLVVRIDAMGRALEHVVHVTQAGHDNVMWVATEGGGPWRITFDKPPGGIPFQPGTPFSEDSYLVARGWFVMTMGGPLPAATGTYKYNVRDANTNVITDDPDVDVDP